MENRTSRDERRKQFINGFISKLEGDMFIKDNQPNNGPELTNSFVEDQLKDYECLLDSGLVKLPR